MDRFVADPHWHGYITWYFFLGGIAAGSYAVARLADLFGDEHDRRALKVADYLAFPLVCVCGVLLVVDLGRPERFWHMLIQSNTLRPMLKWWSPMSVGSWGLSLFGAFSVLSFVGALADDRRLGLGRWSRRLSWRHRGRVGRLFAAAGTLSALFLGAYTGVLLAATNQPIWANTEWLGALFLASATSTGLAAVLLALRWRAPGGTEGAVGRIERADHWAIGLELLALIALVLSLGGLARPAFGRWPGVLVPAFVVPVGLLAPLALGRLRGRRGAILAPALVLVGGFALRSAILGIPGPLLVAGR